MTTFAYLLDVVAVGVLLHTVVNTALLRRVPRDASIDEPVSILMPMRDEANRLEPSLRSVLSQRGLQRAEILVYDDQSEDATATVVTRIAGDSARLLRGGALPAGWLGKPHACWELARAANGSVLVYVDADVVLSADAVAGAVALLRSQQLAFVSPYPRQITGSWMERLVQPLLQWSWLSFLPLRIAERSSRRSLAAANGQLFIVDAAAYLRAGGHEAVRDDVLDDVALARALVGTGGRGGFVDGHTIASCRMYDGPKPLVDGYGKSLWHAFGSPVGAVLVAVLIAALGVLPWLLVIVTAAAWPAALAGPAGRLVSALRTGSRPVWDAALHPLSVIVFAWLVGVSLLRRRRGQLVWKGRLLG